MQKKITVEGNRDEIVESEEDISAKEEEQILSYKDVDGDDIETIYVVIRILRKISKHSDGSEEVEDIAEEVPEESNPDKDLPAGCLLLKVRRITRRVITRTIVNENAVETTYKVFEDKADDYLDENEKALVRRAMESRSHRVSRRRILKKIVTAEGKEEWVEIFEEDQIDKEPKNDSKSDSTNSTDKSNAAGLGLFGTVKNAVAKGLDVIDENSTSQVKAHNENGVVNGKVEDAEGKSSSVSDEDLGITEDGDSSIGKAGGKKRKHRAGRHHKKRQSQLSS